MLPRATLGEYRGLEVGRAEPEVKEEQLQHELDGLRERLARLEAVQRPAAEGDFVVIDYAGSLAAESGDQEPFAGGEGRDQLVELGSGNLIEGFERELIGASAGERRTLTLTFPADYEREDLAGRDVSFEVTVKEVKLKQLPEVDDDLAVDTGFDTLEDLREDIRGRLLTTEERRIEEEFRVAALDAAVEQAQVQVPGPLIEARAREMWERDAAHALPPRDHARDLPAAHRSRASRRSSPRTPPTPSARCAARRCSPRSSPPRASSPAKRSCWRRSAPPPSASRWRPSSCWGRCATRGAWRRSARISRRATRSS